MPSFKQVKQGEGNPPPQSSGYDLWYYERRGDGRLYFRLAPLGLILLIVPAVLAVVAMVVLFLYNTHTPVNEPDVTIRPRDVSNDPPSGNLIRMPPPPPPQRARSRPTLNSNKPLVTPTSARNINEP